MSGRWQTRLGTWIFSAPHPLRWVRAGQGMVEYALILGLIALVTVVILQVVGSHTAGVYSNVNSALGSGTSTSTPTIAPTPTPKHKRKKK
ncbi:MAG: Flp family type IVb pilin [Candidatus Dormibacteria bacterium]